MSDYRTLLANGYQHAANSNVPPDEYADAVLATPIPDLCPDCKGTEHGPDEVGRHCLHSDAPTIADLLRWGENVAKARVDVYDWVVVSDDDEGTPVAHVLLAALRGEGQ